MATAEDPGPDVAESVGSAWRAVEFPSAGVVLRGRLYGAEPSATRRPAVVMGHGFSATISGMVADRYAEAFAQAGLAVLLYDHRSLGLSDGEPRCRIDPWMQTRGYLDAVTFLTSVDEVDADRIGLWGDSLSGRLALLAAAVDERVRTVAVQVPACGAEMPVESRTQDEGAFAELQAILLHADLGAFEASVTGPLPVVSPDQLHMPSLLTPVTAFRWFMEFGGRFETGWQNRATRVQLVTPVPLDAVVWAPYVRVPTLMVTARRDEMPGANADVARRALARIEGPVESVVLDGGHFGLLYPGTPEFTASVAAQRAFLVRHLLD
jgi:pimeloyl-ACP methyl ester carboxylesterase